MDQFTSEMTNTTLIGPTPIQIPELILTILGFTDKRTLPAAARVCRSWYPNALDGIWHECFLFDLLQTFSPMEYDGVEGTWDFKGHGDFERFLCHARRIVRLRHDDEVSRPTHRPAPGPQTGTLSLAPTAMIMIEANFGVGPDAILLPKIRSIEWICMEETSALQLIPFVARATQLADLVISFREAITFTTYGWSGLARVLLAVATAVCDTMVGVRLNYTRDEVGLDIRDFLKTLKCRAGLLRLTLGEQLITAEIMEALNGFHALQAVDFAFLEANSLEPLLTILGHNVPGLQELRLRGLSDDMLEGIIPFVAFYPILQCTALTTLQIFHNWPVIVTEVDIASMGRAWPQLRTLQFPAAVENDDPGIPLRWLANFAQELPSLNALSIYFDKFDNLPSALDIIPRFPQLRMLAMGRSGQDSDNSRNTHCIVEFLAEVCPPNVKIQSGGDWLKSPFESDASDLMTDWTYWSEVSALVKTAHRLQASAVRRL